MASQCSISIDQLGVTFGTDHVTLADVEMSCDEGSFVSLVGPSGCGKSTLLRCIAELQAPSRGSVRLKSPGDRPQIAFVFQDPTLLPWRDVVQNVAIPLELRAQSGNRSALVHSAIRRAGLANSDLHKLPHMLSGGMRMRVSLARAMVMQPDILLMDEPFAALDDISRQQLNDELLSLWEEQRWTTLFVTHNVAEAVFLSQRVLIMGSRPGQILHDVAVPFDYPRDRELRTRAEFAKLVGDVSESLRKTTP